MKQMDILITKIIQAVIAVYKVDVTRIGKGKYKEALLMLKFFVLYCKTHGIYYKSLTTFLNRNLDSVQKHGARINQLTKEYRWLYNYYRDFETKIDNYLQENI